MEKEENVKGKERKNEKSTYIDTMKTHTHKHTHTHTCTHMHTHTPKEIKRGRR
jgi:hypothetical protein